MPMTDTERFYAALEFACKKHKGQIRKGGSPYISHPIAVSQIVCEEGHPIDWQITALFHDLLEDTDATEEEILRLGNPEILTAVKLLTKEKPYDMSVYVGQIKANEMAKAVKCADRLHNLRCAVCTSDDFKRKYILESIDWYLDLSPRIVGAVKELAATMDAPIAELSLIYEPVDGWKAIKTKGRI